MAMTSKPEDTDLQSEVAKKLDLSVIRYSRVWEDHRTLSRGLEIQEDQDVVISITRSVTLIKRKYFPFKSSHVDLLQSVNCPPLHLQLWGQYSQSSTGQTQNNWYRACMFGNSKGFTANNGG